jgi:hypothetical protein
MPRLLKSLFPVRDDRRGKLPSPLAPQVRCIKKAVVNGFLIDCWWNAAVCCPETGGGGIATKEALGLGF